MTNEERSRNFNDTTGSSSWNRRPAWEHPHACKCNDERGEYGPFVGTPHKHYDEPPFACARCDCRAYDPLYPAPDASLINDNYRALIELEKML